jgi:hypothetical protein
MVLSHTVLTVVLNHSHCRKLLCLSLYITLLGGGVALAKRESLGQLAVTPTPDHAREDDEPAPSKDFSCLPKDVPADEVVSYNTKGKSNLTVEKKLIELKARCRRGKLVDAKGREIRFFRISCWGNPPQDYLEIQNRENQELAALKKLYTVIVFGCNPMIH